jgi:hypothetical protein
MKVHYDIRFWLEGDESWHRAGSFDVSEDSQSQLGSVAEALWHGKPRYRTDEHLGCVHRSIIGELCGLIAQRVCDLVNERRRK